MAKRRTKFTIYALLSVLLLEACEVYNAEQPGNMKESGWNVYNQVEQELARHADLFNMALKLNTCIMAPEEEKQAYEDRLLPLFTIRQSEDGEWLLLQNGKTIHRVITKGILTEPGSYWEMDSRLRFSITCTDRGTWVMAVPHANARQSPSDSCILILTCREDNSPESYAGYEFEIQAAGHVLVRNTSTDEVKISFVTNEPLVRERAGNYPFSAGIVSMVATDMTTGQEVNARAVLNDLNNGERSIEITFRDITYIINGK